MTNHAGQPIVQLRNVRKSFDGRQILNDLSLEVREGESTVIVGMSGSGKSVLMEHLIGFQQADVGQVIVAGVDLSELKSERALQQVRRELALVFQGSALIDSLTVEQNVALPLTSRGEAERETMPRCRELLTQVGIPAAAFELYPSQLSGGMQKRVAIARALVTNPRIILYDEPTTGLDARTSALVSHVMHRVQCETPGLTSITITHDYLSAGHIADRVIYLDGESGQLREVLSREEIGDIRRQFAHSAGEASSEIRQRLEQYFEARTTTGRASESKVPETTWLAACGNWASAIFDGVGAAFLLIPQIGVPDRAAEFLRRMFEFGLKSLLVVGVTGAFVGAILTVQLGEGLAQHDSLSLLPGTAGEALINNVAPLVLGLLIAGRIAASVSAEIGGYRLSRQFDALRAMAVSPERYWLNPIFWASVAVMPMLALAMEGAALFGSFAIAVVRYRVNSALFLNNVLDGVSLFTLAFGLLRATAFGAAVALVGYAKGAAPKRNSEDIGIATTEAVVGASMGVIIIDFVMTLVLPT